MEEEEHVEVDETPEDEQLPDIRSRNSDNESLAMFVSSTDRPVDVFWVNYQGRRVKYKTLEPRETYMVSTFETHPWVFRDADTGMLVLGNYEEVYMPIECDASHPVFTVPLSIPGCIARPTSQVSRSMPTYSIRICK